MNSWFGQQSRGQSADTRTSDGGDPEAVVLQTAHRWADVVLRKLQGGRDIVRVAMLFELH